MTLDMICGILILIFVATLCCLGVINYYFVKKREHIGIILGAVTKAASKAFDDFTKKLKEENEKSEREAREKVKEHLDDILNMLKARGDNNGK